MLARSANLFISIVIAAYNAESTIRECLESIYSSSYKNYEVLLANDGSSDSTVRLAREFPCRILSLSENKGMFYAKDYGARKAKGDLIYFIDSDIVIYKDTLQKTVNIFTKHPTISAVCGSYTKDTPVNNFSSRYRNFRHHCLHRHRSSPSPLQSHPW